jgi:hypothetical protein
MLYVRRTQMQSVRQAVLRICTTVEIDSECPTIKNGSQQLNMKYLSNTTIKGRHIYAKSIFFTVQLLPEHHVSCTYVCISQ